jgi:UDP-N-acetylmuramate--alanine ligase
MKRQVYFLGIGGIGMSALARYFNAEGYVVSGYDRTRTSLTRALESEGIKIHYEASIAEVEKLNRNTLIIYTPAVPKDFEEYLYFREHFFMMLKRSTVLGEIARTRQTIAIAGTHGKTTTATMTAHLLYQSKVGCSAFLGGESKNYDNNYLNSGERRMESGECSAQAALHSPLSTLHSFMVVEADEYDRSFHQLQPDMTLITAADPDHLDIY